MEPERLSGTGMREILEQSKGKEPPFDKRQKNADAG